MSTQQKPRFTGISWNTDTWTYLAITENGDIYEVSLRGNEQNGWADGYGWKLVSSYERDSAEARQ